MVSKVTSLIRVQDHPLRMVQTVTCIKHTILHTKYNLLFQLGLCAGNVGQRPFCRSWLVQHCAFVP